MTTNTITVTAHGYEADYIIKANRASFYGINGNNNHCFAGRLAAERVVNAYLADNGINWNGYNILKAVTVSDNGRDRRADITVKVDVA